MGVFDGVGLDLSLDHDGLDEVQFTVAGTLAHGTHLEALAWAAGQALGGAVLEIGSGFFSTPWLHGWAESQGRWACTIETEIQWASQMSRLYPDRWHEFRVIPRGAIRMPEERFALALVDGIAEDRAAWVDALWAQSGVIVVVHDTEPSRVDEFPGLEAAMRRWPNRRDITRMFPFSTILWQ